MRRSGFTLVEMAIVLVILGLLVGGVLVGRDLIDGAKIRQQAAQLQQFTTAMNTFRSKYNNLPGDLLASTASGLGLEARSGAPGHGDGNGLIEACSSGGLIAGCESLLVWSDLSYFGLIAGKYVGADGPVQMARNAPQPDLPTMVDVALDTILDSINPVREAYAIPVPLPPDPADPLLGNCTNTIVYDPATGMSYETLVCSTPANKAALLPSAAIGGNNFVTVFAAGGSNFYEIAGVTSTDASGNYTLQSAMSPRQARAIDEKLDDGAPASGTVIALSSTTALNVPAVASANGCVYNGITPNPYNVATPANADAPLCQLRVKAN